MPPISVSLLAELTRRLDRNQNNRLESNEARVRGWVGNRNGIVGTREAAESVARGDAVLDRFQMMPYEAGEIARRLAGRNGVIGRDEVFISARARDRIDGLGRHSRDGRITEDELAIALTRGDLAISRDGIYLESEVRTPAGHDRPRPPGGRPLPPPIDPRPLPPPIDPRPLPPPIDPGPFPPPLDPGILPPFQRGASEILADFRREHAELQRVYNSTSMTSDTFKALERRLYGQAVEELIRAYDSSFAERNAALEAIYNTTSMTSDEFRGHEQRLFTEEAEYLLRRGHVPFSERIGPLKSLYDSTSMTSDQFKAFERRLIEQEVDRIIRLGEPITAKLELLKGLYNGSSMTSSERQDAERRILASERDYRYR